MATCGLVITTFGRNGAVGGGTGIVRDLLTGVGEDDVLALNAGAVVSNVGSEHIRERVDTTLLFAAVDGNECAVLVHLTVADEVEPRPGQEGVAAGGRGGDLEVPVVLQWAASHVGVDDLEGFAAVVAEGDLAGST